MLHFVSHGGRGVQKSLNVVKKHILSQFLFPFLVWIPYRTVHLWLYLLSCRIIFLVLRMKLEPLRQDDCWLIFASCLATNPCVNWAPLVVHSGHQEWWWSHAPRPGSKQLSRHSNMKRKERRKKSGFPWGVSGGSPPTDPPTNQPTVDNRPIGC